MQGLGLSAGAWAEVMAVASRTAAAAGLAPVCPQICVSARVYVSFDVMGNAIKA